MKDSEFIELVEQAIDKLEIQGKPSKNGTGGCFYQSENGDCCIVGHMMPDSVTRELADSFEDTDIMALTLYPFEWVLKFTTKQLEFLLNLQAIHDSMPLGMENDFSNSIDKMREVIGNYQ